MKKKLAGIPMWAWIAVAAGGLLIGVYLRRKGGSGTANANAGTLGSGFASQALGASGSPSASGGGATVATALPPDIYALVAQSQNALVGESGIALQALVQQSQTLAGLAASSTQGALNLAGSTTSNAFAFATSALHAAGWSGGGGGGGGGSGGPTSSSAPANTVTTNSGAITNEAQAAANTGRPAIGAAPMPAWEHVGNVLQYMAAPH